MSLARHGILLIALSTSAAASAPDGGAPARPLRFAVPKVMQVVEVPEKLFASNYPVTVRAVKSAEKTEALIKFFLDEFEKADLYIAPPHLIPEPMRSTSITGLDTNTLISYTVIFQENPDMTTTAIMTETAMGERRPVSGPEITAVFPGASGHLRSSSEGMKTLSYSAPAGPGEVERFYREMLPKAGYKESEPGTFARPGEELKVYVRPEDKGKVHVTVLQRLGN